MALILYMYVQRMTGQGLSASVNRRLPQHISVDVPPPAKPSTSSPNPATPCTAACSRSNSPLKHEKQHIHAYTPTCAPTHLVAKPALVDNRVTVIPVLQRQQYILQCAFLLTSSRHLYQGAGREGPVAQWAADTDRQIDRQTDNMTGQGVNN